MVTVRSLGKAARCMVTGCTAAMLELRAFVPEIVVLTRGRRDLVSLRGALDALPQYTTCGRCAHDLRKKGVKMYPLLQTRKELESRIRSAMFSRPVPVRKREAAARSNSPLVNLQGEWMTAGQAVTRLNAEADWDAGHTVLAATEIKVADKNGRALRGAVAQRQVARALAAQPSFGEGKTRAERKAARREAEKAAAAAKLAAGRKAVANLVGNPA